MLKSIFFTLFILPLQLFSQVTVDYELIESYSVSDISNIINSLGIPNGVIIPEYPVDFYRVHYLTEYIDSMVVVSGAMMIPQNMNCKVALTSYQHGTTSSKLNVPSYNGGEKDICILLASEGNLILAPDHVGLGSSSIDLHPYMHGATEGHAVINLIRAAREILTLDEAIEVELSNQIFMFGYSQGGTSTCHAAKIIEDEYADEFTVSAIAPLSGAYNLSGAQSDFINNGEPYATPGYLPYIILGYQSVYQDLYNNLSDIFVEPYATILPNLFFGHNYGIGYINNQCAPIPLDMIQPNVRAELVAGTHIFNTKLDENDLLSWVPKTRVRMAYCTADEQVHYTNALNAYNAWTASSDYFIEAINAGNQDHSGCVLWALLAAKQLFTQTNNQGIDMQITYHAAQNQFVLSFDNNNAEDYEIQWSTNHNGLVLENVNPDLEYTLSITDLATGCVLFRALSVSSLTADMPQDFNPEIILFPNPTQQSITLQFQSFGTHDISIVDNMGSVLFTKLGVKASEVFLDTNELAAGSYFVYVKNDNGFHMIPFIKTK